jgi:teichuronic acid biosynthesis glycosyltransferase TuaH
MLKPGDPSLVWMASTLWDNFGTDRRIVREMERHARLLWVDPPVSPMTSAERRFGAARTFWPTLRVLNQRVTRLTPTALPCMTRFGVRTSTELLIRTQVRWALRRIRIEPFAVVATNLRDVQGRWRDGVVSALHGTDDYVAGAELMGQSTHRLRALERRAVTQADVVTTLSPLLAQRWSALRGVPVPLIPNGCTPLIVNPHLLPQTVKELKRPVVGLVGTLNARLDIGLIEAVADAGFSLLLVGPHDSRWQLRRFSELIARPQVHYVGRVPEEEAPVYIAAMDVGITPYMDTPFNRASFPLKTLDYISVGRPAVSTALPASQWLLDDLAHSDQSMSQSRILVLANQPSTFVDAIRRIVGNPGKPDQVLGGLPERESCVAELCRAFAARHTWSCRADSLAEAIGLTAYKDRGGPGINQRSSLRSEL